jgi:hypothetical protein
MSYFACVILKSLIYISKFFTAIICDSYFYTLSEEGFAMLIRISKRLYQQLSLVQSQTKCKIGSDVEGKNVWSFFLSYPHTRGNFVQM